MFDTAKNSIRSKDGILLPTSLSCTKEREAAPHEKWVHAQRLVLVPIITRDITTMGLLSSLKRATQRRLFIWMSGCVLCHTSLTPLTYALGWHFLHDYDSTTFYSFSCSIQSGFRFWYTFSSQGVQVLSHIEPSFKTGGRSRKL